MAEILHFASRASVGLPEPKPGIFPSIQAAIQDLTRTADGKAPSPLCSVWYGPTHVTVFTKNGRGRFTVEEWEAAGGPRKAVDL